MRWTVQSHWIQGGGDASESLDPGWGWSRFQNGAQKAAFRDSGLQECSWGFFGFKDPDQAGPWSEALVVWVRAALSGGGGSVVVIWRWFCGNRKDIVMTLPAALPASLPAALLTSEGQMSSNCSRLHVVLQEGPETEQRTIQLAGSSWFLTSLKLGGP